MGAPFVLVVVGTDVHPFDRLIGWVDEWAARHPAVEVFQQTGTSTVPRHTRSAELLPLDELSTLMRGASVVITHGGPATIADARRAGRLPIVVPRDPDLGEHVDGHQLRYATHLESIGRARVILDRAKLHRQLDGALTDPEPFRCTPDQVSVEASITRFEHLVAQLAPPVPNDDGPAPPLGTRDGPWIRDAMP
jgi:UDP-N-acetylglucosamine transferase subunit ALG13